MTLTRRHLAITGASAALGAAAWWAVRQGGGLTDAPDVTYTLLDGRQSQSAHWAGKVMLVNFWATSCTTCVHEMPQIVATHRKYQSMGYDTLAVAMSWDPPAHVASFAEDRQLPFGVAIDNAGVMARRFGDVLVTPTTFLIDRRGRIDKRWVGEPDFGALQARVERLLAAA